MGTFGECTYLILWTTINLWYLILRITVNTMYLEFVVCDAHVENVVGVNSDFCEYYVFFRWIFSTVGRTSPISTLPSSIGFCSILATLKFSFSMMMGNDYFKNCAFNFWTSILRICAFHFVNFDYGGHGRTMPPWVPYGYLVWNCWVPFHAAPWMGHTTAVVVGTLPLFGSYVPPALRPMPAALWDTRL